MPRHLIAHLRCFAVVSLLMTCLNTTARGETFVGPIDAEVPGGWWFTGFGGAGFVNVNDTLNPYQGTYDYKVGNTIPNASLPGTNYADFRSFVFALGPAAHGDQPINFSFAFDLPTVIPGDDIFVQLNFFQNGDTSDGGGYVGEYNVKLGSSSGNTVMPGYALFSHGGIIAPALAQYASVRVSANIFTPWSSGAAFFDTISVTTAPSPVPEIDPSSMGSALALFAGVLAFIEQRRRSVARA